MTFKPQVFPELADKRLSELTDAQKEDAREDWIRANCDHIIVYPDSGVAPGNHVAFLLARIDALRELVKQLYERTDLEYYDPQLRAEGSWRIEREEDEREMLALREAARRAAGLQPGQRL